jgi:hypothetical protein
MKHAQRLAVVSAATLPCSASAGPPAVSDRRPGARQARAKSAIGRCLAVAARALGAATGGAGTAAADPINSPGAEQLAATCPGLGDVLVSFIADAHGAAFQVAGTNTVILPGVPGISAPGLVSRAQAEGTVCIATAAGPPGALQPFDAPVLVPVVIVNG